MADKEIIDSETAPEPVGAYPHARRVGNLLFLSGIGPRRRGTDRIPEGIEAQCRSVFDNVRQVLEDAGAAWEDLIDVTVFLTDIERDFDVYNRLYTEYFGEARPCRTTVEVNRLPTAISIELKCIASIDVV
ncbi:MAG: RidA family protein [Acidobacteria bacterium]|nr:MAG: RidA family protein [Acidobacteriota bacterium]